MMSICWTILGTVISGVLVHYLIEKLDGYWLEPYHEYKKVKGQVIYALSYYANVYANPGNACTASQKELEEKNKVSDELRRIGCELFILSETRKRFSRGIPLKEDLTNAGTAFIGLSNGLFAGSTDGVFRAIDMNERRVATIKKSLNIE